MTAEAKLEPSNVNVRVKISALWTSMLFVFAYVDLFSLYRADFRADLEAGEINGFTINQSFLLGTTAYVVIPSLMVFGGAHPATASRPNREHRAERRVRGHHHRRRDWRVELLHPRQRCGGRTSRDHRLLRLDMAEGGCTSIANRTNGDA
jgi:hypothetical protein